MLGLFLIVFIEFILFLFSKYPPNTLIFINKLFITFIAIFIYKILYLQNKTYYFYSLLFITGLSLILCALNLSLLLFHYFQAYYYGFNDFSQIRNLHYPFKLPSNEWVTLLLALLPFNLATLITSKGYNRLFDNDISWIKFLIRVPTAISILLIIVNLFITFSRGGYIAFIFLVILLNILFIIYRSVKTKTLIYGNVTLIVIVIFMFFIFNITLHSTINSSVSHTRSSMGRINLWSTTINIFKDYPITGIGSNNYPLINTSYKIEEPDDTFTGRVNNLYIQLIAEKGLVGFILYLLLFFIFNYYSYLNISRSKNAKRKTTIIIFWASMISILIRELFFSSIFYNAGLLLLLMVIFVINTSSYARKRTLHPIQNRTMLLFFFIMFILIVRKDIEYCWEKKQLNQLTLSLNNNQFDKALKHVKQINIHKIKNSQLIATCGIVYERMAFDTTCKDYFPITNNYTCLKLLEKSKYCFTKAIELNPYEDVYYHNLSWLYHIQNKNDSALYYIDKAIDILSNSSIYYLSKGIFLEKTNPLQAFDSYKESIKLSPDITNSKILNTFNQAELIKKDSLIRSAICDLKEYQELNYSTIILARIGKLYLDIGNIDSANIVFKKVVEELPNLNRPWYYLGYINEIQSNYPVMLDYYHKAIFLDADDYLPMKRLSIYYEMIADSSNSEYYKKKYLQCYRNKGTENYEKAKRKYNLDIPKNNIIPFNLAKDILPEI